MDQNLVGASQLPIPPGTHLDQVKFFSSTTDIVLLSVENIAGTLFVMAEVDSGRSEVCEHNFLLVFETLPAPDMDYWQFWCMAKGAVDSYVYILRNAPYSLPS